MKLINVFNVLIMFVVVSFVSGCVFTQVELEGKWKDPRYAGEKARGLLIIFISDDTFKKKVFEDTVGQYMEERGIETEVGYKVFPADVEITEELVKSCIVGINADAILVSRELGTDTEKEIIPGYYETRPDYNFPEFSRYYTDSYSYRWNFTRIPTETVEVEKVYYDTRLFNCTSEELIWHLQTKVRRHQRIYNDVFEDMAAMFYRDLRKNDLL